MVSLNENYIFMHNRKHWVVNSYPYTENSKLYWNLNTQLGLDDIVDHGYFAMNDDGYLVLRPPNNDLAVLWESNTMCENGYRRLELKESGNLAFSCNFDVKWDSMSPFKKPNPSKGKVSIDPGDYMISINESFIFKHDEKSKQWVARDYPETENAKTHWELNKVLDLDVSVVHGRFALEHNGNVVLRSPNGGIIWESDTRCTGIQLELEKGGNLVFKATKCSKPVRDQPAADIFWEANYRDLQDMCNGPCGTSVSSGEESCLPKGTFCANIYNFNCRHCCNGSSYLTYTCK